MRSNQLLIFDLKGEYGHFRKFNTTTSPLTYAIPTRPALAGLLGAILGMERETGPGAFPEGVVPVQEVFTRGKADLGIQLLTPVKKTIMGFNLIDTKKSYFEIKQRTQIPFELVKDPHYRIYFRHEDEALMKDLKDRLKRKAHHFTPYLGLSQFTAEVQWVDRAEAIERAEQEVQAVSLETALSLHQAHVEKPINFGGGVQYLVETMPLDMDRNRVVHAYGEVILESKGKQVAANLTHWTELPGWGNISFL
ncbi:MAG: type I-B CRISPR-associated protein Cas5b [Bacteroidota bacterium]